MANPGGKVMLVPFVPVVVSLNTNFPNWIDFHEYSSIMRLPATTHSLPSKACSLDLVSFCGSPELSLVLGGEEGGWSWEIRPRECLWVVVWVFFCPSLQLLKEASTMWKVTGFGLSTTGWMQKLLIEYTRLTLYHSYLHSRFWGLDEVLAFTNKEKSVLNH